MNLIETVVLKRPFTSNSQEHNDKILERVKAAIFKAGIQINIKPLPSVNN